MNFWKMVFSVGLGADFIRKAVKTTDNPFGDITPEEFKQITGEEFIKVVPPVAPPEQPINTTPVGNNTTVTPTQPVQPTAPQATV